MRREACLSAYALRRTTAACRSPPTLDIKHLVTHMASHPISFYVGAVVGSLAAGFLFGLIPAIAGGLTSQKRLAYVGFLSCLVAGGVAGILLAVPVSLGFGIVILVKWLRRPEPKAPEFDA